MSVASRLVEEDIKRPGGIVEEPFMAAAAMVLNRDDANYTYNMPFPVVSVVDQEL